MKKKGKRGKLKKKESNFGKKNKKKGKIGKKNEKVKKKVKKKECTVDYYCNPLCIGCGRTVISPHPLVLKK
jgi:hypothetical protein